MKYRRLLPLLILLIAFGLRATSLLIESLWRDEVDTIRFAFQLTSVESLWESFSRAEFNGPLYQLLMRGWLTMAGTSDFALRYFSLVCGVLLVAMVYALGASTCRKKAGLVAMWLCSLAPVEIWYSGEGKMYTLQPLLVALALYSLRQAVTSITRQAQLVGWLSFVLATSASYYTHLLSPLFLPVALVAYVLWRPPFTRLIQRDSVVALVLVSLPYIPLIIWQIPILLQGRSTGHPQYAFDILAQTLALNWSFGLQGFLPAGMGTVWLLVALFWLSVPVVATLLALDTRLGYSNIVTQGPNPGHLKRSALLTLPIFLWLLLPPILLFIISLRSPVFEPRYVVWCAPALYLLLGALLTKDRVAQSTPNTNAMGDAPDGIHPSLPARRLPITMAAIQLCILSTIALAGDLVQWNYPIRPDLRGAAEYMRVQLRQGDAVIYQIPYTAFSFEHYTVHPSVTIDGPFTNKSMDYKQVGNYLIPRLTSTLRVWLVESEAGLWDESGLARTWLEQTWRLSQHQEFFGVTISLFERK